MVGEREMCGNEQKRKKEGGEMRISCMTRSHTFLHLPALLGIDIIAKVEKLKA